jgi:hypothetical protein
MTRKSLSPRTARPSWLTAGLLTISLGIVALVASFPLTMLKDAGWPWQSSMSEQVSPPSATAKIVEEDGTIHQFTGAPSDTRAWLASTEDELMSAYGIDTKIAIGQALNWIGLALLAVGSSILFWRAFTAGVRPRRPVPAL